MRAGSSWSAAWDCRLSRRRQQGILRGLDRLDLSQKQLDPIELAADLRLQMRRQLPSVSGAQRFKPRPPVAPHWRVVADALREQKTLDPVHMRDALLDQCSPLAAKPPPVLLFRRGRDHHRAHPWLAALVGEKRPQQCLAIEAVSTTWLSIPSCCRTRWSQNPSSPASWSVMIG